MKAIVQRVTQATLSVDDKICAQIGVGLVVLLGIEEGDGQNQLGWMAEKIVNLRIFSDDQRRMNRSVLDIKGEVLLVPNFTVAGCCQKGRRPSFDNALASDQAKPMFERMAEALESKGITPQQGIFGAHMLVELTNDGPVTLILNTEH